MRARRRREVEGLSRAYRHQRVELKRAAERIAAEGATVNFAFDEKSAVK